MVRGDHRQGGRKHIILDTSILLVWLQVPGYFSDEQRMQVRDKMKHFINEDAVVYLSLAAAIETGNHIAHVPDGGRRRECAEKLVKLLEDAIEGRFHWRFLPLNTDDLKLKQVKQNFINLAQQGIGMGDALIIESAHRLKDDLKTQGRGQDRVIIWTFDERMKSWSPDPV